MRPLNFQRDLVGRHLRAADPTASNDTTGETAGSAAGPDKAPSGRAAMSRRAFTAVVLGVALAGCAGTSDGPIRGPRANGGKHGPQTDSAALDTFDASAGSQSAHGPAAAPPAPVPGRDQIAAEYQGKLPGSWDLQLPGIQSHLAAGSTGPLLTFDCCGGPAGNGVDQALIDALTKAAIPAVFFLNSRWIQANPGPARALADNPLFEIGNHGTKHVPLSVSHRSAYGIAGTASPVEVYDEVMPNQDTIFKLTGKTPRLFRPGTAYYDDVAVAIVRELGLVPLGFSINGDAGATFPASTVAREVSGAKAGDIVICHANRPTGGTSTGISRALADLSARGIQPARFAG